MKARLLQCAGEKIKLHWCLESVLPAAVVCDTAGSVPQCRDLVLQRGGIPLSLAMARVPQITLGYSCTDCTDKGMS